MLQFAILLLVFLPYVSPGLRFPTEVQPWAALSAWALLGLRFLLRGRFRLTKADYLLIGLAVALALYLRPGTFSDPSQYLRKSVGFLFSIAIYLFARDVRRASVRRATTAALGLYLGFALMQYLANGAYTTLIVHLVPIAPQFGGGRGASSLSPEATDFGFTAVYLFVLSLLTQRRRWPPDSTGGLLAAAAACVFLSKSGSGIIALVVVVAAILVAMGLTHGVPGRLAVGLVIVVSTLLTYIVYDQLSGVRGVQLLVMMVSAPGDLLDTSFVYRFVHNWAGVMGFIQSRGLGYGAGSFVTVAPGLYASQGLGSALGLSEYYAAAVAETLATFPAGVVPMLLLEYGILGLGYLAVVAGIAWMSGIRYRWAVVALLAMSWLQSFPVAYPPFWLMLGLCRNPGFIASEAVSADESATVSEAVMAAN